jgi:hypothetical protein
MMPNFKIPRLFNGTFKIEVRRTSEKERELFYGFVFDAGSDATEDEGTRWSLEVFPNEDSKCSNKPFFWLVALEDGNREFFEDQCTSAIDDTEDDWNELKVIRNGDSIKVYINDQLKGDYSEVPSLTSNDEAELGYFLLRVVSASNDTIYVEYDNLEIRSTTDTP